MKFERRAIALAALSLLYASSGFGQSPGQSLGSDGSQVAAAPIKPPAPVSNSKVSPLSAISLDTLHATRERPLFAASRRPPPPPVVVEAPKVEAPPPAPEKPPVTLVGVIYGPNVRIGVFSNESDKTLLRARAGESVVGWTVHDIDRRAAMLEKANEHVRLELNLPLHNGDMAAMPQDPGVPLHGTPVGTILPFSTANRDH